MHGPSGVPSRPGGRDDAERIKRLQFASHNAGVYRRRGAAKGAAGGAQPVAYPLAAPVIGGDPASVIRPPVSGVPPAGVGRPPVNGGAPAGASAACPSEIPVLQNGLIADADATAARSSAACEALREQRLACF